MATTKKQITVFDNRMTAWTEERVSGQDLYGNSTSHIESKGYQSFRDAHRILTAQGFEVIRGETG